MLINLYRLMVFGHANFILNFIEMELPEIDYNFK